MQTFANALRLLSFLAAAGMFGVLAATVIQLPPVGVGVVVTALGWSALVLWAAPATPATDSR